MSFEQFGQLIRAPRHYDRLGQALALLRAAPVHAVLESGDDDPTTDATWAVWDDGSSHD